MSDSSTSSYPSLSRQFARWAHSLRYGDLPDSVRDKAQAFLLHALTGAAIAHSSKSARHVVELALAEEGKPDGASVFHSQQRASRIGAAFANSEWVHASSMFDSYRMLNHPGPVIIPAALACAEMEQRSGSELLVALVAGYEFICRLTDDFIPSTAARGFRPSPVFATLGAALSCGLLLGLDEDGLVSAIALAANFASGLNEGPRTGGNELMIHEPQAARNGVFAAVMARAGHVKGSETSLEGPAGFYNAFIGNAEGKLSFSFKGQTQSDPRNITVGLGREFKLLSFMFRMYPCAGYNQPVIELMRELREVHALAPNTIARIRVAMNSIETLYPSPLFPRFSDWQTPRAGETTHYFVAYTAVHGAYPVAGGQPPAGAARQGIDPAAAAFMPRVELVPEPLRSMFSPEISVELLNGTVVSGDYPYERMVWNFDKLAVRLRDCVHGIAGGQSAFQALESAVRTIHNEDLAAAIFSKVSALQSTDLTHH
jgi:2-methylcitrate dehydratase PrpD